MDCLQSQPRALDDGVDDGVHPLTSTSSPFTTPSRMPYSDQATLAGQDMKKGVRTRADKYAKYAGDPPDGGLKAWSVILAASLTSCATFGYAVSWGIFQSYYEEVMLPLEAPSDIAWIGSVQLSLIFLPALVTGRLFDIGYLKIPHFIASCFLVLCTFLVAECKLYWQFFLVQGLGIGLSGGILFGPTMGIIPHWFSKRRGLAMGVSSIGAPIGGTIFPIVAQQLIPNVGFKWTIRIFGLIIFLLLGITNLTLDRRLPPVNVKGGLFNWAIFRNLTYTVYCAAGTTGILGLYTLLVYQPISAVQVGISNTFTLYLVAFANAISVLSRILAGYVADRVGAHHLLIPFTIVAAVTTIVWPYVKSEGGLIGIALVYGFSYGVIIALFSVPLMTMGSTHDVGRRLGLFASFIGFGCLAGTPISGAINAATHGFVYVGWYAGGVLLFSAGLLIVTRYPHLGKCVGKD